MEPPQTESSAGLSAPPEPPVAGASGEEAGHPNNAEHPHNFDAQKDLHQRIRNDPDYDDWEYGTEPLPHEAWPAPRPEGEPA